MLQNTVRIMNDVLSIRRSIIDYNRVNNVVCGEESLVTAVAVLRQILQQITITDNTD